MVRITISLENELEAKIKEIQKQFALFSSENWSLSKIINMVLFGGIIGSKNLKICDWYTIRGFMDGEEKDLTCFPVEYASYFAAHEQMVKYSSRERLY